VRILGLSGYARAGKDTAAEALIEIGWKRLSMADKLKTFVMSIDKDVNECVSTYGWEEAKASYTFVRRRLQEVAMAARDVIGEDVWVQCVIDEILGGHAPGYVITDVRFPNECRLIKAAGGAIVRIERTIVNPMDHVSERALDNYPFDATIYNDFSISELHERIRNFVGTHQSVKEVRHSLVP
jgi:hypothetical protein